MFMQTKFIIIGVLVVLGVVGIVLSAGADQIGLSLTQDNKEMDEFGRVQIGGIVLGAVMVFSAIIVWVMYKPKGDDVAAGGVEETAGGGKEDSGMECPTCGSSVAADATECPECGEQFEVQSPEEAKEPVSEEESEEPEAEEPEAEEPESEEPEADEPAAKEPAAEEPGEEAGEDGGAEEYECPTCGAKVGESDIKCPECGEEFE